MGRGNILITGGSGLVGTRLTEIFLEKGFNVSHLSRKEDLKGQIKKYKWEPSKKEIDKNSLNGITAIVHLAGAGVADERWTDERKKEILNSRVESTQLLYNALSKNKNTVETIVSSSAIGYYGFSELGKSFTETSSTGADFLATVTQAWENEVDKIAELKKRIVKLRIGVVFTDKGGALPQMAQPIKLFAGSPLGSGNQIISWIDIDDLCNMFIFAIENTQMKGAYNAVAPKPVSNSDLTNAIANVLKRPVWPIKVPKFMLGIIVGEMQVVVTGSCDVANKRIKEETSFKYQFADLETSLRKYL